MNRNTAILLVAGAALLLAFTTGTPAGGIPAGVFELINKWEVAGNVNDYLIADTDTGGVWTVGYGSTWNFDKNRAVQQGDKITADTAYRWYLQEIQPTAAKVNALVKVPINNNQRSALISFAYNIGLGAFQDSTLLRLLNANQPKELVAAEFDRWVYDNGKYIPGLANRRADEKKLFLS